MAANQDDESTAAADLQTDTNKQQSEFDKFDEETDELTATNNSNQRLRELVASLRKEVRQLKEKVSFQDLEQYH